MSSKITVHGRASSANVQKVVWALEEMKLPYERLDVGGKFGGTDTPDFGAMNPNRLVPVLTDGNLTIWESHAILRYLAGSYSVGNFWPEDPAERATIDQWTDWTASTFQPAWLKVFMLVVRTAPQNQDKEAIAKAVADTGECLKIMNEALADRPFLAGEALSYADFAAGVSLYRWTTMEIERPEFEHVTAWHERLLEREAFAKSVNISYEELQVT